jgi:hypothetical protein
MLERFTCAGFSKAMHREVEQAVGTYALRELSEDYGREFAPENEALGPENTIPWQQLLKLLRLILVRPVTVCSYWDLARLSSITQFCRSHAMRHS